ncbi:hypothetical protein RND71_025216 [Anisodus tanguticus]|uniref:Uncharacterized protein n=1 Tax=Anisodus tanguticus TaxID=243964 RepID=A0AAE1VD80_9SOLA|nr:hypothetical protein RND71_025216 [Anisodus tanguticus]
MVLWTLFCASGCIRLKGLHVLGRYLLMPNGPCRQIRELTKESREGGSEIWNWALCCYSSSNSSITLFPPLYLIPSHPCKLLSLVLLLQILYLLRLLALKRSFCFTKLTAKSSKIFSLILCIAQDKVYIHQRKTHFHELTNKEALVLHIFLPTKVVELESGKHETVVEETPLVKKSSRKTLLGKEKDVEPRELRAGDGGSRGKKVSPRSSKKRKLVDDEEPEFSSKKQK